MTEPRFPTPLPTLEPAAYTLSDLVGVRCAGVAAGIKASGRPDVALLVADAPLAVAGVFTRNRYAAAPVEVCRAQLEKSSGRVRAIVVNSGNANACTGEGGLADAWAMARRVARLVGCPEEQVLVSSTGVIGRRLPMERVLAGIDAAHASLEAGSEAGRRFLAAIMTTDAFPKEASAELTASAAGLRVAGVCKGAGMIEPDMATMLAYVGTDLALEPEALRRALPRIASRSFNGVHVDGHASTNDSFLLFSTGAKRVDASAEAAAFAAVERVARRLAWLIARDGEGASKVTTIEVRGARSDEAALSMARAVAHSALVRTALFGNDPNWGRFVSQVGNSPELGDARALRCALDGVVVFERGEPVVFDAAELSRRMASTDDLVLRFELGDGTGEASVMTSDLGYRYVEVNAEYTT
jgi:glutamate N-acetyltransferase / amino-acid N-acetyltransferase